MAEGVARRGPVGAKVSDPKPGRLVFVSHAGEDAWVARQIAREIEAQGARAILDEADVDVGSELDEDIRRFLDEADELIVLFTPWSLSVRSFGRKSVRRGSGGYPSSSSSTALPSQRSNPGQRRRCFSKSGTLSC